MYSFDTKPEEYIVYTDGRGAPEHGGWVSFKKSTALTEGTYSTFPLDDTMKEFFSESAMDIALVEAWSVLVALKECRFKSGSLITIFVDNENALAFIRKGYCWDFRMTWLVSAIWKLAAEHNYRVYFKRVFTKSNIADSPSREIDLKQLYPNLTWTEVTSQTFEAPIGWKELMKTPNARGST